MLNKLFVLCKVISFYILRKVLKSFYGEDPQKSKDLGRIVNERNFNRLVGLMDKMPKNKLAFGGKTDIEDKYIG